MIRPMSFALFLAIPFLPAVSRAAPSAPAGGCPHHSHANTEALVAAVIAVVAADVGIPAADATPCPLDALPSTRAKLLPFLPHEHRALIADCARGRTRTKRGVRGFELLSMLEEPVEATGEAAAIRAFFDERTVDVALGSACSDGPYPIAFDWVVVLDTEAHTLYSFIVNCSD